MATLPSPYILGIVSLLLLVFLPPFHAQVRETRTLSVSSSPIPTPGASTLPNPIRSTSTPNPTVTTPNPTPGEAQNAPTPIPTPGTNLFDGVDLELFRSSLVLAQAPDVRPVRYVVRFARGPIAHVALTHLSCTIPVNIL
jgi:hypothetical protein